MNEISSRNGRDADQSLLRVWWKIRRPINYIGFGARFSAHLQLMPGFVGLIFIFALPMLYLLWISLWKYNPDFFGPTPLTLENYTRFLFDGFYMRALGKTMYLGLVTTILTVVIAYPVALIMARSAPRIRGALILLVLFPLMVSVVVRVFGWMVILGNNGILNRFLMWLGIIQQPLQIMESMTAVVIGLVQVWMAFAVLPIYSSLVGIGRHLEEAAATLGAKPWQTFRHVVLPLSMPGVAGAVTLVFSLTVASFVQPQLLGGSGYFVMTTLIYQQITATLDWPFGATIGVLLLIVSLSTLGILGVLMKQISPRGGQS